MVCQKPGWSPSDELYSMVVLFQLDVFLEMELVHCVTFTCLTQDVSNDDIFLSLSERREDIFFSSDPPIKSFPDLSVHTGLGQAIVHDAQCTHAAREAIMAGAGAWLTRMPISHL